MSINELAEKIALDMTREIARHKDHQWIMAFCKESAVEGIRKGLVYASHIVASASPCEDRRDYEDGTCCERKAHDVVQNLSQELVRLRNG